MKNLIISIVLLANISCQGQIKNENTKTIETMDSRDQLMDRILTTNDTAQVSDNSGKSILARGCDPEMGRRSLKVLPPLLGNPKMVSGYNDNDFIEQLKSKKWSVVFFAPGACRRRNHAMGVPESDPSDKGKMAGRAGAAIETCTRGIEAKAATASGSRTPAIGSAADGGALLFCGRHNAAVSEIPTFTTHLECSATGRRYPADVPHGLSGAGKPLLVRYDLEAVRRAVTRETFSRRGDGGFWRYRELLPVRRSADVVSLGEVVTPLVPLAATAARHGARRLLVKDEGRLPRLAPLSFPPIYRLFTAPGAAGPSPRGGPGLNW